MTPPLIETVSLTRRYGRILALDSLSVRIEPGITGLIGANGAGKSTLVKILLGLIEPTSGSASVMGHDAVRDARAIRALVGYMPEHDCLPPDLSATEFVTWMARCSGLPPGAARERAAETLRHVGLFEERYRLMGGYSTGMAQRVKLAQSLVHDPRILVLDEPTNGLDPAGRDEMLSLIHRTGREFGISVLVSSHLLGELERVCDAVVLVEQGRLLRAERLTAIVGETGTLLVEIDGDSDHFVGALIERGLDARHQHARRGQRVAVVLPDDAGATRAYDTVRDVAVDQGLALLRMERHRGSLEDLFTGTAA